MKYRVWQDPYWNKYHDELVDGVEYEAANPQEAARQYGAYWYSDMQHCEVSVMVRNLDTETVTKYHVRAVVDFRAEDYD